MPPLVFSSLGIILLQNVLHFVHDLDWKTVVACGHWKDHTGCTRLVEDAIVVGDAATK